MRRTIPLLAAALVLGSAASLQAQSGFALKGHYLFNESNVRSADDIPAADGFGLGAELVLPMGLGVGVTGYTTGSASQFDREATSFGVLAEANYFVNLPILPITPYVGVHAGLGQYTVDDLDETQPEFKDDRNQLGFQVGARWQLSPMLGLDAQYRRVSESAAEGQSGRLERNQVLVGVTLF